MSEAAIIEEVIKCMVPGAKKVHGTTNAGATASVKGEVKHMPSVKCPECDATEHDHVGRGTHKCKCGHEFKPHTLAEEKHQPGKHDQASHAGTRGAAGRQAAAGEATLDKVRSYAAKEVESARAKIAPHVAKIKQQVKDFMASDDVSTVKMLAKGVANVAIAGKRTVRKIGQTNLENTVKLARDLKTRQQAGLQNVIRQVTAPPTTARKAQDLLMKINPVVQAYRAARTYYRNQKNKASQTTQKAMSSGVESPLSDLIEVRDLLESMKGIEGMTPDAEGTIESTLSKYNELIETVKKADQEQFMANATHAEVIEAIIKHQPGKHDQSTHAGKKGAMSYESVLGGRTKLENIKLSQRDADALNNAKTKTDRINAELGLIQRDKKWTTAGGLISDGVAVGLTTAALGLAPLTGGVSLIGLIPAGFVAVGPGGRGTHFGSSLAEMRKCDQMIARLKQAKARIGKSLVEKSDVGPAINTAKEVLGKLILQTENTEGFSGSNEEKEGTLQLRQRLIEIYKIIKDL